jgi:hypothetical protein
MTTGGALEEHTPLPGECRPVVLSDEAVRLDGIDEGRDRVDDVMGLTVERRAGATEDKPPRVVVGGWPVLDVDEPRVVVGGWPVLDVDEPPAEGIAEQSEDVRPPGRSETSVSVRLPIKWCVGWLPVAVGGPVAVVVPGRWETTDAKEEEERQMAA